MSSDDSLRFPLSSEGIVAMVHACHPKIAQKEHAPRKDLPAVVAIGAFDGVHVGHRQLIEDCVRMARQKNARSVVVTFDPDPSEVILGTKAQHRLLGIEDRETLCRSLECDEVKVIPFTKELSELSPQEFVELLLDTIGPILTFHVGENFRFGAGGTGDTRELARLGESYSFDVVAHPLLRIDGEVVSSTLIRSILAEGRGGDVTCLLKRCHFVRGVVVHGRGEGTSFGFPTANVCCDGRSCLPAEGVYACVVTDGKRAWPAAANVGAPPTFSERRDAFLEANLIGFEGDLYDRELSVIFVKWLRASRRFSSLEELEQVVLGNIDWVRCNLGDACVEVDA